MKLLEITKQKLHNIKFGNDFLGMTPKTQATTKQTNLTS